MITTRSQDLFFALVEDASNWSGTPLFGGNVGGDAASKGNLTQLKKASLVTTIVDEDDRSCSWVVFTDEGKAYAAEHGFEWNGWGFIRATDPFRNSCPRCGANAGERCVTPAGAFWTGGHTHKARA